LKKSAELKDSGISSDDEPAVKTMLKIVLICLVACLGIAIGAFALFYKAPEFDSAIIEGLKVKIRDEANKTPGTSVTEVSMIRESARKAIGFAKYRRNGGEEMTMNCTAIMEEGSYQINLDCR
jgi:hypothetical protein